MVTLLDLWSLLSSIFGDPNVTCVKVGLFMIFIFGFGMYVYKELRRIWRDRNN